MDEGHPRTIEVTGDGPVTGLESFDVPADVDEVAWTLAVFGRVDRELELRRSDVTTMDLEAVTEDFSCVEGWTATDLAWRGIRIRELFARAGPVPDAAFCLVHGMDGDYACNLPIERAADGLLAVELDGEPLPIEHGGPARLVLADRESDCWESVKWVSKLEVLAHEPVEADTASEIALSRLE